MKYFSSLFAVIGIAILMVELSLFNNQYELYKRDFDTARLKYAISYSEEGAFAQSLQSGNIDSDYTDQLAVTCDPTYVLDTFANIMCINYDMAEVDENRERVMNSVDAACLANNDGYYMALLSTIQTGTETAKNDVYNEEYEFKWTPKIPFTYEMKKGGENNNPINAAIAFDLHNPTLFIYDYDTNQVYKSKGTINKTIEYKDVSVNGGKYKVQRTKTTNVYKHKGGNFSQNCVSDGIKYRVVNNILANALNYNISKVAEKRGGASYNVHLPASTTGDGLNPVIGNSLMVIISDADYAGKANLTDAVLSGHRATNRVYVIAFEQDGKKYYCKNGQLPMTERGDIPTGTNGLPLYTVEKKFLTEHDAAMEGYNPHYTYLQVPLDRE